MAKKTNKVEFESKKYELISIDKRQTKLLAAALKCYPDMDSTDYKEVKNEIDKEEEIFLNSLALDYSVPVGDYRGLALALGRQLHVGEKQGRIVDNQHWNIFVDSEVLKSQKPKQKVAVIELILAEKYGCAPSTIKKIASNERTKLKETQAILGYQNK